MKTLIFDVFHVFRYTWFTMEALEDTWENLQKIIEVCNFTSEIFFFFQMNFVQIAATLLLAFPQFW